MRARQLCDRGSKAKICTRIVFQFRLTGILSILEASFRANASLMFSTCLGRKGGNPPSAEILNRWKLKPVEPRERANTIAVRL